MTFITNIIVLYAIISMYRKKSIFEPYPVSSIPKQTGVEMSHIHNDFSDTTVCPFYLRLNRLYDEL